MKIHVCSSRNAKKSAFKQHLNETSKHTILTWNLNIMFFLLMEYFLLRLHRWNSDFKKAVWSSRVDCTKVLADAISKSSNRPKVFISMSGVGNALL